MLEKFVKNPLSIKTATRRFETMVGLRVIVETTGFYGGDAGHGGRTSIVIDDFDSEPIVSPYPHDPTTLVKFVLGGDEELRVLIPALRFAADALEVLSKDDHLHPNSEDNV